MRAIKKILPDPDYFCLPEALPCTDLARGGELSADVKYPGGVRSAKAQGSAITGSVVLINFISKNHKTFARRNAEK